MSDPTANDNSQYKNEPAFRYVSGGVIFLACITILLILWFTRNDIPIKAPRTITLYSFAAMETVMEQALIPAFQEYWMKEEEERVEFITTFAGAGVITRQIMTQFPAEVAILSSELDARILVTEGIINAATWQELKSKQKFCRTPIVMFVRDNIPVTVSGFDDIDFTDLKVIIPDPLISGVGQMTSLALYGSRIRQGDSHEQALGFTLDAFASIRNHPSNSQDALEQFHAGIGDLLINYEAARAFHPGAIELKVIFPLSTIMVEPFAVTIDRNIRSQQESLISAFLDFLWEEHAQKLLSDYGFRTINTASQPEFAPAPVHDIFTLNSLGSASELNRTVINPLLKQSE